MQPIDHKFSFLIEFSLYLLCGVLFLLGGNIWSRCVICLNLTTEDDELLGGTMENMKDRKKRISKEIVCVKAIKCSNEEVITCAKTSSEISTEETDIESNDSEANLESNDSEKDDESNDTPSCIICLDHFNINTEVSWSRTCSCQKVFHYNCISTWLSQHNDCPYCRSPYLSGGETSKKKKGAELHIFCINQGLLPAS